MRERRKIFLYIRYIVIDLNDRTTAIQRLNRAHSFKGANYMNPTCNYIFKCNIKYTCLMQ